MECTVLLNPGLYQPSRCSDRGRTNDRLPSLCYYGLSEFFRADFLGGMLKRGVAQAAALR